MNRDNSTIPPAAAPEKESQGKVNRSLGLIFSIMLMDVVGLLFLAPVSAFIVQKYSPEALMVTMITVIYAAAQFFAAPLMGKLGDRYGRRPVLLVSLVGQAIGYVIFGVGGALWVLFAARFIGGVTGGNLSTASAYIADVSSPQTRARNFTLIGIAWGLGLILGPALGAILGEISLETPAFAAAGLTVVNVLLGLFILPESLPKDRRERTPIRLKDFNPVVSIAEMARKPGLGWLLAAMCLFSFAFNGINSTSTLFFIQKFGVQPGQVGMLLMVGGITLAVVQFLLVQGMVRRFGERAIAIASLLGQGLAALGIFFTPFFWLVFPINMLATGFSGFTFPTLTTLTTNCVQPREVGLLMGVTTALGSLMNIAGPLWAGAVYDGVMAGAPFWMGAGVFVLAGLMLFRQPQGRPVAVEQG